MPDNVPNAGDEEEDDHDGRHPSEGHDGCEDSTGAVDVAPVKISPIFSGDGGTNEPQGEEDEEYD